MKPMLTRKTRIFYFFALAIIFIMGVPALILFATGWRFGDDSLLEKRGGIYVTAEHIGAEILIDWVPYHTTTFFNRDYLKQDADVGIHEVEVRHPERRAWYREVEVKEQVVTPLYPFLIPQEYEVRVLASTSTVDIATSTEPVDFSEYHRIDELFAIDSTATTTRQLETLLSDSVVEITPTTTPETIPAYSQLVEDDIVVWYDGYTIYAYWDNYDWMPARFCNVHSCVNPMPLLTTDKRITHLDFYPGRDDVVIYTLSDGIYVAEIDKRPWPVRERIMYGEDIDFRIQNNNLYVKEGDVIVELEL